MRMQNQLGLITSQKNESSDQTVTVSVLNKIEVYKPLKKMVGDLPVKIYVHITKKNHSISPRTEQKRYG